MTLITGVNQFKFYLKYPKLNNKEGKLKSKYARLPLLNNKLSVDTVSFSGSLSKKPTNIDENKLICDSKIRKNEYSSFSDEDINKIKSKITSKNREFLPDLLTLNDKELTAEHISEILDYINKDDINVSEFREKMNEFKNLSNITSSFAFLPSALSEYIGEIPSQGIKDILTSPLLLRVPKDNLNSFSEAYNNTVKVFNEQLKKIQQKQKSPLTDSTIKMHAKDFMKKNFSSLLILGMIFDRSVFNELVFNRGKYINSIYMPRLRTLTQDDIKILRKVQTDAVTDKENKSGDIVSYEISLDDKISMLNLLYTNRELANAGYSKININDYLKPVNQNNCSGNFVVDFQGLKIDLLERVLRKIGVDKNVVDKYMSDYKKIYAKEPDLKTHRNKFWDIKYVHLLNAPEGSLLKDIIVAASSDNMDSFLFKKGPVAEINNKNKAAFENEGIKYSNWISPTISPIKQKFVDKTGKKEKIFTVKNWNRNPYESLFDGNYTTCCTGLDKDQGPSFPIFLSNTCTTTLEVRTEKNKVIAMSRILMAKIDGKLSMVVENIEVNNKMAKHYLYDDETKYKFREMIFDYAREFSKNINNTKKEIPVYFSAKYYKVKDIEKGLKPGEKYYDVKLIGEFPDKIYVNAYGGRIDRAKLQYADDGDEFSLYLSNISKKAKPKFSKIKNDTVSEADYNYADTEHYNR